MRSLGYFARTYPSESGVVVGCLLLAAIVEGVGFSTLLPILSLAASHGDPSAGPLSGFDATVRAQLERFGIDPTLVPMTLLFVATLWLRGAILLFSRRRVGYTVARIATDLRLELLRALLGARWGYFTRQPVGTAANAMATEAERASVTFHNLALLISGVIDTALYAGLAIAVSPKATLAAALSAGVAVGALSGFVRMAARAGRKQTGLLKSLLARLTDTLQAVKRIKATGREIPLAELLTDQSVRLNRQLRRRVLAQEALRSLQEPVVFTFIAVGILVAIVALQMPFPSLAVLGLLFTRTLARVSRVQRKYQSVLADESALWSIRGMIERAQHEAERSGERPPRFERGLEFHEVRARYDDEVVLDAVNLEIPARGITAIVGPSGSGKTTLVDLITGLIAPDAGEVRIDGVPLAELDLRLWRQWIGYVPQDVTLLHDSIRTNVTLGAPELDDASVERALRAADAWEFVARLPEGTETVAGERGSLFSGGQRQRIGIAAALVHEPKLLILDEATAALDAASERRVWESVRSLSERMSVIAISHQPALIQVADRAFRITDGRVSPLGDLSQTRAEGIVA